jgi:hypothetical protein
MSTQTAGRLASGALATAGVVAAILVITRPAGLNADWLSWLGAVQMVAFALLALLPSIVAGTVRPADMRSAIAQAETPLESPAPIAPGMPDFSARKDA